MKYLIILSLFIVGCTNQNQSTSKESEPVDHFISISSDYNITRFYDKDLKIACYKNDMSYGTLSCVKL